jgi:ABC-type polysaccharide/polyol phosphate transport system ATPase subunit
MEASVVLKAVNISKSFPALRPKHDQLRAYFWNIFSLRATKEERALSKQRFWALEDINFEVKKGHFFSIIGKNGAGKSTLLKIIAGIYEPDTGYIQTQGHIIPFLELGVGFNPQLTARENIYLNGIIMGMTKKEIDEKYEEILEFAELKEFEYVPLKNFSSGMQVRLAFAVASQAQGDIYLLDEVFAVGDISFQKKALKVIEGMIAQGKTFIYVGHSMETVRKYSTNVLYLKDHKVAGIGRNMIDKYISDMT